MDPAKVSAVAEWPTPDSRKKVQLFCGFANFCRWVIRGFSAIAAPLHALTSSQVQFWWSPEAEAAFQILKLRFTSAPILTMSDPHSTSLWWRLTPLTKESGQYSHNNRSRTARCTHVPSCHGGCPGQRGIIMWATRSYWWLKSPWRNGDTGWRELVIRSLPGLTIRTSNISRKLNNSILARPGWCFSLTISPFLSPTDRGPETSNPTPCPDYLTPSLVPKNLKISSH